MGEGGSSLLLHVALLGAGFALGRARLLAVAAQALDELLALSAARKIAMAGVLALLVAVYALLVLLPLDRIAREEAERAEGRQQAPATSFRRELRRRGSYSMSYVADIKAHVFGGARAKGIE